MKPQLAISLWQPWASFVAAGMKKMETRSWARPYRGPLLIHAAKRKIQLDELDNRMINLARGCFGPGWERTLPLGALVARCELTAIYDIHRRTTRDDWGNELSFATYSRDDVAVPELEEMLGHYDNGRFAWKLERVQKLHEPVPCRGAQGLFYVRDLSPFDGAKPS